MNNQTKFKVWDKLAQHMIYPDKGYQQHYILDLNGRFHNLQNGSGGDDYVVMEYTGLTDSNDKEICEGDILIYKTGVNGQVLYEVDQGAYIFQWKRNGPNQNYINLNCDVAFESVIVGNIFENSELLK
jgi:uncharacterized phage protein (TIGR01671 family)